MFQKGKCTSHPKWLPHLKPNPSRGSPRDPGSPHAHPWAALPYTFTVLHIHTGRRNTQTHNTGMKTPAKRAWHNRSHQPPGFVVKAPRRPNQRQEASGLSNSHTSASKGASPQACVLCSGQVLGAQLPASTWGPVVASELTQKGPGGHWQQLGLCGHHQASAVGTPHTLTSEAHNHFRRIHSWCPNAGEATETQRG